MGRNVGVVDVLLAALGAGLAFASQVSESFDWVYAAGIALLIAGFVLEPLLVLGHELGHAIAARAVGMEVVRVRVGHDGRGLRFRFAGFDVELSWQGYTGFCELGGDSITPRQLGTIAAAGPLASLVLAAMLGLVAALVQGGPAVLFYTVALLAASSAFMGIGNAVPVRRLPAWWPGAAAKDGDEGPSDGYLVLHAVRGLPPIDVAAPQAPPAPGMTDRARDAIIAAGWLARGRYVGTEHLLQGLLTASGPAAGILRGCGITEWPPSDETAPLAREITPAVKRVLQRAHAAKMLHGDERIDAEHLLLGLVDEPGTDATKTLTRLGVNPASVRRATLSYLQAA